MKELNTYIIEKLKLDKNSEYSAGKVFDFINHYIFGAIQKINTDNLKVVEDWFAKYDDFDIYCIDQHKQIWGKDKKEVFLNYVERWEIDKKFKQYFGNNLNGAADYYMGGGIYIFISEKKDAIYMTIANNEFNNFDHGYEPILITKF